MAHRPQGPFYRRISYNPGNFTLPHGVNAVRNSLTTVTSYQSVTQQLREKMMGITLLYVFVVTDNLYNSKRKSIWINITKRTPIVQLSSKTQHTMSCVTDLGTFLCVFCCIPVMNNHGVLVTMMIFSSQRTCTLHQRILHSKI